MPLSKCSVCYSKKSKFIKEANGFLGNLLGEKIPVLGDILLINTTNTIVNKFLLARDKFIPEMHLRQPGRAYSGSGPFTKHKKRIKEFKGTGDSGHIYQNKIDKACFQHDMANGDFKDSTL